MRTASPIPRAGQPPAACNPDRYKWVALSNTTLGILMATIDSSIVLISLPAIFRGIDLNPLVPSNTSYLLWMLMGYMVVTAVLVVSFGRIGDMFGRVKIYNLGFAIFTAGSLAASLTYFGGPVCRPLPDRHAHRPGGGRGDDHGQLDRHHHRRLPRARTGHGAGHQLGGRHRRVLHRAGRRRAPGRGGLAPHLLRLGADRAVRDGLGVPEPSGGRQGRGRPAGLAGQHLVRRRPRCRPGGDHLRPPALRGRVHGLAQPPGARPA